MNFIIENTAFVKVPQIFFIKTNEHKLGKFKVKDNTLRGKINIDLEYFDSDTKPLTTKLEFDYQVNLPENTDVEDLRISDLKLHTIDNLGVDCVYTLDINTKVREESTKKKKEKSSVIENQVKLIQEDNIIMEEVIMTEQPKTIVEEMKIQNAINEELKQELTNSYDKLLEENLEKRELTAEQKENIEIIVLNEDSDNKDKIEEIATIKEEIKQEIREVVPIEEEVQEESVVLEKEEEKVNVEIISTSSKSNQDEFIRFFDSFETRYYSLKTIYCQSEEDLNKISKDYNISIETLLKSFDKQSKSVIVKDVSK